MAENSGISWTHHTHNRWMGCAKVSAGCKHCYAEGLVTGRMGLPVWGVGAERKATSESTRKQLFTWNRKAHQAGERHRVFCSSLADVFEDRADLAPLRAGLFRDIEACTSLDFLLLTKRPERMLDLAREAGWSGAWPANVWAGCTVEMQSVTRRIDQLLQVPARVRFLSIEPQIELVDLAPWLEVTMVCVSCRAEWPLDEKVEDPNGYHWGADQCPECKGKGNTLVMWGENQLQRWRDGERTDQDRDEGPGISWVICGGESGPDARTFRVEWARFLKQQCKDAGVSFFMKQLGARPTSTLPDHEAWPNHDMGRGRVQFSGDGYGNYDVRGLASRAGSDPAEWPADLRVREFPGVRP